MKIVFLDVDGVLNSAEFFKGRKNKGIDIDESRVILLSQIIKATNAKIVLSSSWRNCRETKPFQQLPNILGKYGMEIMDYTGNLGERGKEIQDWLNKNQDKQIEKFVILDDESFDMGIFVGNELIQTSWHEGPGLTEETVAEAIGKLNNT